MDTMIKIKRTPKMVTVSERNLQSAAVRLLPKHNKLVSPEVEYLRRVLGDKATQGEIDEKVVLEGLQKVANRITLGLVVAALIVGAAMLMRVETSFRIFGYPGLAMIFFLLAAAAGLVLVFSILFYDEKRRKKN